MRKDVSSIISEKQQVSFNQKMKGLNMTSSCKYEKDVKKQKIVNVDLRIL